MKYTLEEVKEAVEDNPELPIKFFKYEYGPELNEAQWHVLHYAQFLILSRPRLRLKDL